MLPSIFGENLFDDFFSDPFTMMVPTGRDPLFGKHAKNLMKTDVRETEDSYELDVDLPGFKKDEVTVDLQSGYLTISAAKGLDKDEQDRAWRAKNFMHRRCMKFFFYSAAPCTGSMTCTRNSPPEVEKSHKPPRRLAMVRMLRQP